MSRHGLSMEVAARQPLPRWVPEASHIYVNNLKPRQCQQDNTNTSTANVTDRTQIFDLARFDLRQAEIELSLHFNPLV